MSVKKSATSKSLLVSEKLQENVLPTQINVINHYNHLKKQDSKSDSKFFKRVNFCKNKRAVGACRVLE